MGQFWSLLGVTWQQAVATVIATVVLYVVFVVFLALAGRRLWASPSSFELAIVTVLGAIVGRSTMGNTPTMAAGLIALTTLALLELGSGVVRRTRRAGLGRAWLVATADGVDEAALRASGLRPRDLRMALRQHGIRGFDEVAAVIVESHGRISVLRAGHPIDPQLLRGVRGSERLAESEGLR